MPLMLAAVQVHDSLAEAPPNNVHMLNRGDVDGGTTEPHESSDDSARLITGARSTPTRADDGRRSHGKSGCSDLDRPAKYGHGSQLPRPAKTSKHSRHWAGSKNILDYFMLRVFPAACMFCTPSCACMSMSGFQEWWRRSLP